MGVPCSAIEYQHAEREDHQRDPHRDQLLAVAHAGADLLQDVLDEGGGASSVAEEVLLMADSSAPKNRICMAAACGP
jgi:hypothetical protein